MIGRRADSRLLLRDPPHKARERHTLYGRQLISQNGESDLKFIDDTIRPFTRTLPNCVLPREVHAH